jgi:hypothetical protein
MHIDQIHPKRTPLICAGLHVEIGVHSRGKTECPAAEAGGTAVGARVSKRVHAEGVLDGQGKE